MVGINDYRGKKYIKHSSTKGRDCGVTQIENEQTFLLKPNIKLLKKNPF